MRSIAGAIDNRARTNNCVFRRVFRRGNWERRQGSEKQSRTRICVHSNCIDYRIAFRALNLFRVHFSSLFFSIVPRLSRKIVLGSQTISLGVIARHRQRYYSNVIPLHKYASANFV